jgi:hypothetical protein
MTRGKPPLVAIDEAMRKAAASGTVVFAVEPAGKLAIHFITHCDREVAVNRVRRLKLPGYSVPEIESSCRDEIAEVRVVALPDGILRMLWVRGPDRRWYRYRVLPETVEQVEEEPEPAKDGAVPGAERNDAPGSAEQPR